jgi:TatA/E family protein of Tat protein translocase
MHALSLWELVLIFGIVLILFGGSRLASVGKALGEGIANFKKGLNSFSQTEDPPSLAKEKEKAIAESYVAPSLTIAQDNSKSQTHIVDVEPKDITR